MSGPAAAAQARVDAELEARLGPTFAADVLAVAPVIVLVLAPDGTIAYVNPFFERLTGHARADVQGRDWFAACLPGRDHERIRAVFARAVADGAIAGVVNPVVTRDGAERDIEWHARVLRDDAGAVGGVVCVGKDVTDELRARDALRASEARLCEAQRLARIGSWELCLDTGRLQWSDEVYRIFELDPTSFGASYQAFLAAVHEDDRAWVDDVYQASVRTRAPYDVVHRLRLPDGRVKHVRERGQSFYDAAGRAVRSIGTVQDVTPLVTAERRLRRILDGMEVFVVLHDLAGDVLELNRELLDRCGARRGDVVGRPGATAPWWDGGAEVEARVRDALARAGAGERVRDDLPMRMLEGPPLVADVAFAPLLDDHGDVEGVIVSAVDVTEHRRAEAAHVRQEARIAAQLADNEVLLRELHHRVKNNLQVIQSLLSLQRQRIGSSVAASILDDACARVAAMSLVHDKLHRTAGDLSRIDLVDYARELVRSLRSTYAVDAARVHVTVVGDPVDLTLDRAVTYGLLLNELLTNAFKHAFPGGRPGAIEVRFSSEAGALVLEVRDDGIGMPAASSPTPGPGATLGLDLIAALVGQLGGTLRRSGPPGTRYAIELRGLAG